jgi:sulfite exporter TauE/SafE
MIAALAAGLAAGVLASAHCAAMCGPLAMFAHASTSHRTLYHAARIGIYVALGVAAGLTGALAGSGIGTWLALAIAAMLLLHAIARARRDWSPASAHAARPPAVGGISAHAVRMLGRVTSASAGWIRTHRVGGPVLLGVINGLLPCGLLYAAVAAALGLGRPAESAAMMAGFGLGTTPILVVVGSSTDALRRALPLRVRRAFPLALVVMALLLIMRGLVPLLAHTH